MSLFLFLKNWIIPKGTNIKKLGIIIHPRYVTKSSPPLKISSRLSLLEFDKILTDSDDALWNKPSFPWTSILYIIIGDKIKKKSRIEGKYVFKIFFENLNFIKNRIVKTEKRNIPSDLTIVANETSKNDKKIVLLSYLKKRTKEDMLNKMNNGSVIPNKEFKIILGSKANNATPIKD